MILTEQEAVRKWCPFARTYEFPLDNDKRPVSVNRTGDGVPDMACYCIASGCMAWHWLDERGYAGDPAKRRGYCGIATSNSNVAE